jgi:alkylation response protein AidB-like acyl-CoA dehydrogenase|tara:strand:+ start:7865 stop:8977 length:1113 start_codon:yes stop_codon:yes gene_type:complete
MPSLDDNERNELQNAVARLLSDRSSESDVRKTMETESGFDAALWQLLAEMGIVGLLIDEQYGGSGAGAMEIERVMEEVGAALLCSPLLASAVLAASVLGACGDEEAKRRLLPDMAKGSSIATLALTGEKGTWTPDGVAVRAERSGADWTLSGKASFVMHGQNADVVLVVANTDQGTALFQVEPSELGGAIQPLPAFDHTLRLAQIEFEAAEAQLIGADGSGWMAVEQALNMTRAALAGEQAGGARKVLDMTVEYAKNRVQFGRAIGSFQAIKHMAADLLLESESATSAARHAAMSLATAADDSDTAISLAGFACADAFSAVTAASIQMHGGIGFTWDHPAHLYLRRARADAQLFGTPMYYRERYVQHLGG